MIGGVQEPEDPAETWFLTYSAGSGPYVLASYKPSDELRLEKNQSYWRDAASINDVVLRQVKDAVAQSQLLENGGADIAMQIDPDTAKSVRGGEFPRSWSPLAQPPRLEPTGGRDHSAGGIEGGRHRTASKQFRPVRIIRSEGRAADVALDYCKRQA